jgi:hypothetical protein
VRGGSSHCSDEEERSEDKCEGNHRVKENNTNIIMAALLRQEETKYCKRRSVDKWAFNERTSC